MDTGYQAHKHCWLSMWAELAPVSAHGAGGGEGGGWTHRAGRRGPRGWGAPTVWATGPSSTLPTLTTQCYLEVFHHVLLQEEMQDVF